MTEVQDATDRAAEPVVCPRCGKTDHVQKMSAIPDMASALPPPRPSFNRRPGVVLAGFGLLWLALLGCIGLALFADAVEDKFQPLTEVCTLGLIVGIAFIAVGTSSALAEESRIVQWRRAMSRWELMHVCGRDQVAFIPGETSSIPLDEVRDSLGADPEEFADFRHRRSRRRDMIKLCPNCDTENAADAVTCSECGTSLTRAPTGETAEKARRLAGVRDTTDRKVKRLRSAARALAFFWALSCTVAIVYIWVDMFLAYPDPFVLFGGAFWIAALCLVLWGTVAMAWRLERNGGVLLVLDAFFVLAWAPYNLGREFGAMLLVVVVGALPALAAGILFLVTWWISRNQEGPETSE